MNFPDPVIRLAIEPKTKADQERLGLALTKLAHEDPTFKILVDADTGQTLIAGMGELHLEILVDRLRREFEVSANVGKPQVAYRETITTGADGECRYVRQTGGRGQFAHVKLHVTPGESGSGFVFENRVVGGSIPKEFIGPVRSGVEEVLEGGILAGYPMTDVHVEVYDGSFHEVDSSDMAFRVAGSMAFRDATRQAGPTLLEPVMRVEITVPLDYTGEVINDLNSRRGRIQKMESESGLQVITVNMPMAEMFGYATALRSVTQGRGNHSTHFSHYDEVPKAINDQVAAGVTGVIGR